MAKQGTLFDFDSRTIARNLVTALHKLAVLEGEGIATPYHEVAAALDRLLDVVIADVAASRVGADKLVKLMRGEAAAEDDKHEH